MMISETLDINTKMLATGNCKLLTNSRQLFVKQEEVPLTGLEYNLLRLLLSHSPELVSHDNIASQVFTQPYWDCQASISTHISHLRTKLNAAVSGLTIKSVRGQGYFLSAEVC